MPIAATSRHTAGPPAWTSSRSTSAAPFEPRCRRRAAPGPPWSKRSGRETTSLRALRRLGLELRREDFAFRADSHLAQLAAIRAGLGIGVCQTALARRDPNLVHILPDTFAMTLEMWLAMHQDLRASRAMRAMFDHLAVALADYARPTDRRRR